jgi:peptidoglycan hydrolase CwlO-like protein
MGSGTGTAAQALRVKVGAARADILSVPRRRPPPAIRLRVVAVLQVAAVSATLLLTASGPAYGESAAEARHAAEAAAEGVDILLEEAQAALAEYERSLDLLARSATTSITADALADASARRLREEEHAQANRVRALYMSGGPVGMYSTVLGADSPADALHRTRSVRVLLSAGDARLGLARAHHDGVQARIAQLDGSAIEHVTTASEVQDRWRDLQQRLTEAQHQLDVLVEHAAELEASEAAEAAARAEAHRVASRLAVQRARLAETSAQAASLIIDTSARARARLAPAEYHDLYVRAAATCPGLDWSVLSAIGQVESGHGRNIGPSSAGALGPMQFMPRTFAAYGVDGDGDGVRDILNPADSVFSAANYLCASGASQGSDGLRRALFAYNRAQWYVELVLEIARQLAAEQSPG